MNRVYLDYNATTPLRPEAKAAMIAAMEVVGNPSSVHAEGRAAKAIVEKARGQVAALLGCNPSEIIFTAGATEAAATVMKYTTWDDVACADVEHSCIIENIPMVQDDDESPLVSIRSTLEVDEVGRPILDAPNHDLTAVCAANSETGVLTDMSRFIGKVSGSLLCDATQLVGKGHLPWGVSCGDAGGVNYLIAASHKIGGPKGVGVLAERGSDNIRFIGGGGQELNRRAGTENVIGIAGYGAAAEAAQRDVAAGLWSEIAELRDWLEVRLADAATNLQVFGQDVVRLPNTTYFAVPGWKGETQVMQMDLAGFAVSAGSACSSGKVKASKVLKAMGVDEITASSALRISLGLETTRDEVERFADTWIEHYRRYKQRAA